MNLSWASGERAAGRLALSFPLWVVSSCLMVTSPSGALLALNTWETEAVEYGGSVWRGCRPRELSVVLFLVNFHLIPKLAPSQDESRANEESEHSAKLEEKESRQSGLPPSHTGRRWLSRHLPEAHFIKRSAKSVLSSNSL